MQIRIKPCYDSSESYPSPVELSEDERDDKPTIEFIFGDGRRVEFYKRELMRALRALEDRDED